MGLSQFFHRLPEYLEIPSWNVLSSVIERSLYVQKSRVVRHEIFPHQQSSKDKYLNYIPCAWTIVNNCTGVFLDSTLMWDMMVISMLGFLVDEYMKSVVAQVRESDIVSRSSGLSVEIQASGQLGNRSPSPGQPPYTLRQCHRG